MYSNAHDLEVTLDEVVAIADDNLDKMARMERPTRTSVGRGSSSSLSSGKMVGSSRGLPGQQSKAADSVAEISLERKIEFLYRRTKLIDEKLKNAEKERLEYKAVAEEHALLIEHIAQERKTDQKQILQLREHVASMKSQIHSLERRPVPQVDQISEKQMELHLNERESTLKEMEKVLVNQTRLLEEHEIRRKRELAGGQYGQYRGDEGSRRLSEAEVTSIVETIKKLVKKDFNALVQDVVKSCAAEQARFLSKWAERSSGMDNRSQAHAGTDDIVPAVEKEVARVMNEFSKLKSRQEMLEDKYRDLHSGVALREKRAEEAHRRAISSYKKEMHSVVDAVGRRINDYLSDNSRSSKTVLELSIEVDEVSQRVERQRSDLMRRCEDIQSVQKQQQQLIEGLGWLSNQPWATDDDVVASMSARGLGPDTPLSVVLSSKFRELNGSIDTCSRNHDFLAQSVGALVKQLKSELNDLSRSLTEHRDLTAGSIESVHDFNKKIKAKVNEVTSSVATIAKVREAVESLLMDVDLKSSNESEDSPHAQATSSALMKLGMRIQALEERLEAGGAQFQPSLVQYGASGAVGVGVPSPEESHRDPRSSSQPHVLVYRKLQEEVQQEFARLQSEVEEALQVGWQEIGTRSVQASQNSVKAIEDSMQRVQGIVMSMHKEQRLLSDRIQLLENSAAAPRPTTATSAAAPWGSSSSREGSSLSAVLARESVPSPTIAASQSLPVEQSAQFSRGLGPSVQTGFHSSSGASTTALNPSTHVSPSGQNVSGSDTQVDSTMAIYENLRSNANNAAAAAAAATATATADDEPDTSSVFARELVEAVQRLHVKKNQHRSRFLKLLVN